MSQSTIYCIRPAVHADDAALARLAEVDSQPALTGDVLLAEVRGIPVAAIALADGRTIGDPFRHTAVAQDELRVRARALGTTITGPSLRMRMRTRLAPLRLVAAG